ncbi:hypothetical protein BX600DRAFT_447450 [Xylariales sp. PMI_506]|nr:hypothetical protein BX600DRAFT_447450 [Xylariales sp. PMI_506]
MVVILLLIIIITTIIQSMDTACFPLPALLLLLLLLLYYAALCSAFVLPRLLTRGGMFPVQYLHQRVKAKKRTRIPRSLLPPTNDSQHAAWAIMRLGTLETSKPWDPSEGLSYYDEMYILYRFSRFRTSLFGACRSDLYSKHRESALDTLPGRR